MDEKDVVYTHTHTHTHTYTHTPEILHSCKKKTGRIPFAATRMYLEIIILSEVSQTEKDKNELIYKTETDPQIQKQTYSYAPVLAS